MPSCENCGSYVTAEFARVFGTNEDEVYGCLDCVGGTAIRNGAGLPFADARVRTGGADR